MRGRGAVGAGVGGRRQRRRGRDRRRRERRAARPRRPALGGSSATAHGASRPAPTAAKPAHSASPRHDQHRLLVARAAVLASARTPDPRRRRWCRARLWPGRPRSRPDAAERRHSRRRPARARAIGCAPVARPRAPTRARSTRWKRSSGSFSIARSTAASTCGGMLGIELPRAAAAPRVMCASKQLAERLRVERQPPGEHLVEDARRARRCRCAGRSRSAAALLGRHVRRACRGRAPVCVLTSPARVVAAISLAMPKSSTLTKSAIAVARDEEDVVGLEVAVDDAVRVRRRERAADAAAMCSARGERRARPRRARAAVPRLLALEELHDEVGRARRRARRSRGCRRCARVPDLVDRARLVEEARARPPGCGRARAAAP